MYIVHVHMYYIQKRRRGGVVFNEPIAHILYGAHARAVPGNHAQYTLCECGMPHTPMHFDWLILASKLDL